MRQNAWSDRLTQLRQELDDQRAASEAERTTMMQEHHKKLMEVSEDCKTQVIQARRQVADAELAAVEASAKLAHDLKEALHARDAAESQLQQQADSFSLKLAQAKEDAAREMEKAARQEKHRLERQQLEFDKTLRQREEDFEHQLKQREQELSLAFEARLAEEQTRVEQDARRREAELERQFEARARKWTRAGNRNVQQKEELFHSKSRQQRTAMAVEARLRPRRVARGDRGRHAPPRSRHRRRPARLETRLRKEMSQKDEAAAVKAKLREQDLTAQLNMQADARQMLARVQWETESENRSRAALEQLKTLLARTEKERDEARQSAIGLRQQIGGTREETDRSLLLPQSLAERKNHRRHALMKVGRASRPPSGARTEPERRAISHGFSRIFRRSATVFREAEPAAAAAQVVADGKVQNASTCSPAAVGLPQIQSSMFGH